MRKNRTLCPSVSAKDYSSSWSTETIPCVPNDRCVCADSSFVRELVNVTLEGLSCYACEPRRPPACTEEPDQCTPEACECADLSTHVKQAATTTTGTLCHYCEPIGGFGSRFGLSEAAIIAMLVSLVFLCQWGGKKPALAKRNGSLRLSRRQGDRSRAIKVHMESVGFFEECLFIIGDVFDALIAGVCELAGGLWSLLCFVCGALASLSLRISDCAGTTSSKVYAACVQCGQRFRDGAVRAAKATSASAQNVNKAPRAPQVARADAGDAVHTTAPGVRKRGGRKDAKACSLAVGNTGQPASLPQEPVEAPLRQESVGSTTGNRARDHVEPKVETAKPALSRASKANAGGSSTPARHHSVSSANASEASTQVRHKSTAKACESENSMPMRHQAAVHAAPPASAAATAIHEAESVANNTDIGKPTRACKSKSEKSTSLRHQSEPKATDRADDSPVVHEDDSSRMTPCLSGGMDEPALRRLSTDCPQTGDPPRADGAANILAAGCSLTSLRTFLGEPIPKVVLRRTASDSDLALYS